MVGNPVFPYFDLNPKLLLKNRDWDDWLGGALFDRAVFSSAARGGDSITLLDSQSFAKGGGGGGKPGGGGGGDSGVLTSYRAGSADGDLGYDIWIEFKGSGWTTELQKAFTDAADYFTKVITEDIVGGGLYRGKVIDDLYVTAELTAIDGTGGILGQAGPTAVWTSTELTAAGLMQFDVADAANYLKDGLWDDIVTHELMHVLGFGSLWNYGTNPLVYDNPDPNNSDWYIGAEGLAAYNEQFGASANFIPVEADGGSGTAGAHWDEESLNNELMTGYIDSSNYLSEFSVMSLADLDYTVGNYYDYGAPIV